MIVLDDQEHLLSYKHYSLIVVSHDKYYNELYYLNCHLVKLFSIN